MKKSLQELAYQVCRTVAVNTQNWYDTSQVVEYRSETNESNLRNRMLKKYQKHMFVKFLEILEHVLMAAFMHAGILSSGSLNAWYEANETCDRYSPKGWSPW